MSSRMTAYRAIALSLGYSFSSLNTEQMNAIVSIYTPKCSKGQASKNKTAHVKRAAKKLRNRSRG